MFAFSSEMCGLDGAIPVREENCEFQPMKYDLASVDASRMEVRRWSQWQPCTHLH
jgi:hypothetical protein